MHGKVYVFAIFLHVCHSHDYELFPKLPVAAPNSQSAECRRDSLLYIKSLDNSTLWAYEMRDASSRSTEGILRGSKFQPGHFDECMTAKAPFMTQYCLATISAHVPEKFKPSDMLALERNPTGSVLYRLYETQDISLHSRHMVELGWCIPSSCSYKDLEKEINDYLAQSDQPFASHGVSYFATVNPEACQTPDKTFEFNGGSITFIIMILFISACMITSTILDFKGDMYLLDHNPLLAKSLFAKIVLAFSARRNVTELPKANVNDPSMTVLYGIRTLCTLVVISSHRFLLYVRGGVMNSDFQERQNRNILSTITFKNDLIVDSFFTLSGIMVTYCLLHIENINPYLLVLKRYIRLTPVYAFVIFFYITILDYTGSGPAWKIIMTREVDDCKNNWYLNLLYLNNYIDVDHLCVLQSWYLPADFHFFIIGVFVCQFIKSNVKRGLAVLIALTITSLAIPFMVTSLSNIPPVLQFLPGVIDELKSNEMFKLLYVKSHTRAGPYFVGMIAGYFYYKREQYKSSLSKAATLVITLVSLGLMSTSIFGASVFFNPYHEYDVSEAGIYAALHRIAWSIGTVGVLVLASYGGCDVLQNLLAWRPWIPLGKLCYGAYLTHMIFQLRSISITAVPKHFDFFEVISMSYADWILSFFTAFVLYLLVEAPLRNIFNILISSRITDRSK